MSEAPTPSISVHYPATGATTRSNALGMRPMQETLYQRRREQYLLIKSPPASGKRRAQDIARHRSQRWCDGALPDFVYYHCRHLQRGLSEFRRQQQQHRLQRALP